MKNKADFIDTVAYSSQSLDLTVNRFFMKLFKTSDTNIVNECRSFLVLSYLAY